MANTKEKKPHIILRAFIIFLCVAAILLVLQWLGYHYYSDVAYWNGEINERDSLVYDDDVYCYAGVLGKGKLGTSTYKRKKTIGEVKQNGISAAFGSVITVALLQDQEDMLIVTWEDGTSHIYYKSGTENPAAPEPVG